VKVVILGANGQLGSDLVDAFQREGHDVLPLTHNDVRIEDVDSLRASFRGLHPDAILNAAAFHQVPKCEEDPVRAFQINSLGPLNIARIAEDLGSASVFVSTDYVFDGAKLSPYTETDVPNPLNAYAVTKLAGEYFTLHYCRRPFVLRVSGIYGRVPCRAKGGNFITTMRRLANEKPEVRVVQDEILTPTPTSEIALSTLDILQRGMPGLYHVTSEGECSWYEFARTIFDTLKLTTPLRPALAREMPASVQRPLYSVLENRAMKSQGLRMMPSWKDSLVSFLRSQK
jgi:dTDP-4-dehydrorhamnose reductase